MLKEETSIGKNWPTTAVPNQFTLVARQTPFGETISGITTQNAGPIVVENSSIKRNMKITTRIAGYSSNDVIYPSGNSINTHDTAPSKKKFFLVILFNIKPIK